MYTFVYTKSLDNADDVYVKSLNFEDKDDAITCFNDKMKDLMAEILNNEFLNCKISIHKHKAVVQIEGTRHCIAVVKDGGLTQDEHSID